MKPGIRANVIGGLLPVVALILLALRWLLWLDAYSVNVLFLDQWRIHEPLFAGDSIWAMFLLQVGPVREGLGGLLTGLIATVSSWNTRVESAAIWALLVIATTLAITLRWRLLGPPAWTDVAIPAVFLTTAQTETVIGTPNPAHAALPLCLVLAACHALLIRDPRARAAVLAVAGFALTFTGFGLFGAFALSALLLVRALGTLRAGSLSTARSDLAAAAVTGLSLAAFFAFPYVFEPAIECFGTAPPRVWEFPAFAGLMLVRPMGLGFSLNLDPLYQTASAIGLIGGLMAFAGLAGILLNVALRLLRHQGNSASAVIAVLSAFSLTFCLAAASGRECLGLVGSQAPRYVTLMLPAYLAVHLVIQSRAITGHSRARLGAAVFAVVLMAALPVTTVLDRPHAVFLHDTKKIWANCIRGGGSLDACNTAAKFPVYRYATDVFAMRIAFLRERQLNLFQSDER